MPSSKRDLIKRKHTAIHNAIERAMGWSLELMLEFQEPHPDYARGYEQILITLKNAQDFIDRMKGFI